MNCLDGLRLCSLGFGESVLKFFEMFWNFLKCFEMVWQFINLWIGWDKFGEVWKGLAGLKVLQCFGRFGEVWWHLERFKEILERFLNGLERVGKVGKEFEVFWSDLKMVWFVLKGWERFGEVWSDLKMVWFVLKGWERFGEVWKVLKVIEVFERF